MVYLDYHQFNKNSLLEQINHGDGFVLFNLENSELKLLRELMAEQYLHVIQMHCPNKVAQFRHAGPVRYHDVYNDSDFDHATVWRKPARVLGPQSVERLKETPLLNTLSTVFSTDKLADEEDFGWPGIYWRLVRPGQSDIGPMHADSWFWDLGHGEMPPGYYRLKIWAALWAETQKSGLQVVPGSHKRQWQYHGEKKGNMVKPVLDSDLSCEQVLPLPLNAGQAVIFHDDLLHGGMPNLGTTTRVSFEFTLLVPKEP